MAAGAQLGPPGEASSPHRLSNPPLRLVEAGDDEADLATFSGWAKKRPRSGPFRVYQRRFLILENETLSWYHSQPKEGSETAPRGSVSLSKVDKIVSFKQPGHDHGVALAMASASDSLFFSFPTHADQMTWLKTLIQRHKQIRPREASRHVRRLSELQESDESMLGLVFELPRSRILGAVDGDFVCWGWLSRCYGIPLLTKGWKDQFLVLTSRGLYLFDDQPKSPTTSAKVTIPLLQLYKIIITEAETAGGPTTDGRIDELVIFSSQEMDEPLRLRLPSLDRQEHAGRRALRHWRKIIMLWWFRGVAKHLHRTRPHNTFPASTLRIYCRLLDMNLLQGPVPMAALRAWELFSWKSEDQRYLQYQQLFPDWSPRFHTNWLQSKVFATWLIERQFPLLLMENKNCVFSLAPTPSQPMDMLRSGLVSLPVTPRDQALTIQWTFPAEVPCSAGDPTESSMDDRAWYADRIGLWHEDNPRQLLAAWRINTEDAYGPRGSKELRFKAGLQQRIRAAAEENGARFVFGYFLQLERMAHKGEIILSQSKPYQFTFEGDAEAAAQQRQPRPPSAQEPQPYYS